MGCSAGFASAPVSGADLKRVAIKNSLSLARQLGAVAINAAAAKQDPVAAVVQAGKGRLLFVGENEPDADAFAD